jgi:hypothetical protein
MTPAIQFAGKDHALQLFGVRLVGVDPENGKKLLLSVDFLLLLIAANRSLRAGASGILGKRTGARISGSSRSSESQRHFSLRAFSPFGSTIRDGLRKRQLLSPRDSR